MASDTCAPSYSELLWSVGNWRVGRGGRLGNRRKSRRNQRGSNARTAKPSAGCLAAGVCIQEKFTKPSRFAPAHREYPLALLNRSVRHLKKNRRAPRMLPDATDRAEWRLKISEGKSADARCCRRAERLTLAASAQHRCDFALMLA